MDTIFDRLTREISREERQRMLAKIEKTRGISEKLLRVEEEIDEGPVILDQEFSALPWLVKLKIILVGYFTSQRRVNLTEKFLLKRLFGQVDKAVPGLIDYRRKLIAPSFYTELIKLKAALDLFRGPLDKALQGDRELFYALLGSIEFGEIQERLENEIDPETLKQEYPGTIPADFKKRLDRVVEDILNDTPPEYRQRMYEHTKSLFRLKVLTRFPFKKMLRYFARSDKGNVGPASLGSIKVLLLELGDALYSFRDPPAWELLETLFLFDVQGSSDIQNTGLEAEVMDRMDKAQAALGILRKFNIKIPWRSFLKIVAEDIRYVPRPLTGGEDWFHIYRNFWKNRLNQSYQAWTNMREKEKYMEEISNLWKVDSIPLLAQYQDSQFPEKHSPRYETSFAIMKTFLSNIFPGQIQQLVSSILVDGKFYKKENRKDLENILRRLLRYMEKIRLFEESLLPAGPYGERLLAAMKEQDNVSRRESLISNIVFGAEKDAQELIMSFFHDIKILGKLLEGILEGSGGDYDTLTNISSIGLLRSESFRPMLTKTKNLVVRSSKILSDILELEDEQQVK